MNAKDRRMIATSQGTVDTTTFLNFVRRAVSEKWVESGRLGTNDTTGPSKHGRGGVGHE